MQTVSVGDILHEVSDPIFMEKKKKNYIYIISFSSAEFAHSMVSPATWQFLQGTLA